MSYSLSSGRVQPRLLPRIAHLLGLGQEATKILRAVAYPLSRMGEEAPGPWRGSGSWGEPAYDARRARSAIGRCRASNARGEETGERQRNSPGRCGPGHE